MFVVVTGPSQAVHAGAQADLIALAAGVRALGTLALEVAGLVGLDGVVQLVVQVRGERVMLLRLDILNIFKSVKGIGVRREILIPRLRVILLCP